MNGGLPTPQIGGGSSGPSPVPVAVRSVSPLAHGLSRAAEVTDALAQRVEEDIAIADRIRAVELKGAYRRRINERLAEADATDPEYLRTVGEDFASGRDETLRDHGINSQDVLDSLELDLAEVEQSALDAAAVNRRGALKDKALLQRNSLRQQALEMIRDDPDAYDMHIDDFGRSMADLAPAIPPGERAALAEEFADQAITARVEGLLKAARFDEAATLVDAAGGELDPDHRRKLETMIASAQTKAAEGVALDFSRQIADIDVAIAAGNDAAAMDDVIAEINRMDRLGMFADKQSKRGSLLAEAYNKRARLIEQGKATTAALEALGRGPVSQGETDLAAVPIMQQAEAQGVDATDALVQLASQAGHIPTKLREHMKAAEMANDAGALAGAATLHRRLQLEVPGVDTGIDQTGRVALVDVMTRYFGMDAEQAAKQVIAQVPDPAQRKARGDAWDDLGLSGSDILDDGSNNPATAVAPDLSWFPFYTGQVIPDEASAEAETVARQAYILVGDEKIAKAMAVEGMRQRWGMSQVGQQREAGIMLGTGGRRVGGGGLPTGRVMKYPPEDHFPKLVMPHPGQGLPGMSSEDRALVMDELVRSRLSAAGWPKLSKFSLIPTEDTERRLAAGLPPAYYVSVPSRFGAYAETGPLVETLDDGSERRVIVTVPKDEADLVNSETFRSWRDKRMKAFKYRTDTSEIFPVGGGA